MDPEADTDSIIAHLKEQAAVGRQALMTLQESLLGVLADIDKLHGKR